MDKKLGRPPGRKKTAKIEVLLTPKTKNELQDLISRSNQNVSGFVGMLIENYLREHGGKSDEKQ